MQIDKPKFTESISNKYHSNLANCFQLEKTFGPTVVYTLCKSGQQSLANMVKS